MDVEFPRLNTVDKLGEIILVAETILCIVGWLALSLASTHMDASNFSIVTTQTVFRYFQVSPGGQNSPMGEQ